MAGHAAACQTKLLTTKINIGADIITGKIIKIIILQENGFFFKGAGVCLLQNLITTLSNSHMSLLLKDKNDIAGEVIIALRRVIRTVDLCSRALMQGNVLTGLKR